MRCAAPSCSDAPGVAWLDWPHRPVRGTRDDATAYNAHVHRVAEERVASVDVDEVFFGVNARLLPSCTRCHRRSAVGQLCAPWTGVDSSGLVEQPPTVRDASSSSLHRA